MSRKSRTTFTYSGSMQRSVGGKSVKGGLKPLDEWEMKRPAVRPVDLDEVPAHVIRLSEHVKLGYRRSQYVSDKVFSKPPERFADRWIELNEAAPLLGLYLEQSLRIWYSGLCDAGIIDRLPTNTGRERLRFLRLPKWSNTDGQELITAVQGKERLQGFSCDTGRAGLLMLVNEWVVEPLAFALGGKPAECSSTLIEAADHLRALVEQFKLEVNERNGRFHISGHDIRTLAGQHGAVLHLNLSGEDLGIRQPITLGYNWQPR